MSWHFASGGQSTEASASVIPMNIQGWIPLELAGLTSLLSKRLSRVFCTTIWKPSILQCSAFFMVQLSHPYITTRKTVDLTVQTLVGKAMSLLFNMLSSLVIAFLPRSKHLLISGLQSLSAEILEPKKIKSVTASTFPPSICHEVMGPDAMILVFKCWVSSQLFPFPLSFFIKRLFSSSSLSAIRVLSLAYRSLLIFLPANLISACDSSRLIFHMNYSAYKLNKQGDNVQPWHTPSPILNQSTISCPVLTVAPCLEYRILRRQVRWFDISPIQEFSSLLWSTQLKVLA